MKWEIRKENGLQEKKVTKCKNIIKLTLISLIVISLFGQNEEKEINAQQFLENIRNILKEKIERAKRREEWRKRRKERKKKVKKTLIKKLSSFPRIRRPENSTIHIRKDRTGGKVEDFLKEEGKNKNLK